MQVATTLGSTASVGRNIWVINADAKTKDAKVKNQNTKLAAVDCEGNRAVTINVRTAGAFMTRSGTSENGVRRSRAHTVQSGHYIRRD